MYCDFIVAGGWHWRLRNHAELEIRYGAVPLYYSIPGTQTTTGPPRLWLPVGKQPEVNME